MLFIVSSAFVVLALTGMELGGKVYLVKKGAEKPTSLDMNTE